MEINLEHKCSIAYNIETYEKEYKSKISSRLRKKLYDVAN